jgi:acyl-CoA reductase-like NAD-dependent aldehyde dehydrogenase
VELGGKGARIIFADADLERAVESAHNGLDDRHAIGHFT